MYIAHNLSSTYFESASRLTLIVVVIGFVIVRLSYYVLKNFYNEQKFRNFPLYAWDTALAGSARQRWMHDSTALLREGYRMFPNQPFRIWTTEGSQIALPPRHFDEVKSLSDHAFPSALREYMCPQYTMTPSPPWKLDWINHVIKHDLNRNMSKFFPDVREECYHAVSCEFPASADWESVEVKTAIQRVICRVAGRAFVGTELCRNEEWIQISSNYTRDLFMAAAILRMLPQMLRPFLYALVPQVRQVWRHNAKAYDLLLPIIKSREERENEAGWKKPNDAIEWFRDFLPASEKQDYRLQAIAQLVINTLSIHTVTQVSTNVIFNLVTYPEYVPILLEEIDEVLKLHNGDLTLESLSQLQKLDSFIKESMRHEVPQTMTFQRKAAQDITLSDGTTYPAGSLLFSPTAAIASDPSLFPSPDEFDGLRFYKLRKAAIVDANKYQFTSVGSTQMSFGGGRHTCPGRFFAGHEIKLLVVTLLTRFDMKLDQELGRPKLLLLQFRQYLDPEGRILVKAKTGQNRY